MPKLVKINKDGALEFAPAYFLVDGRIKLDLCGKFAAEQGYLPLSETASELTLATDKAYDRNYTLSPDGKTIEAGWAEKLPPAQVPEDEASRIYAQLNLLQQTIINLQNEWEALKPSLPASN